MFDYQDIKAITHNNGRWYLTPDGPFPSITTVLSHTMPPDKALILQNWRDSIGHAEADAHSKRATDHGTMVHLLIERHLSGQQVDALVNGLPVPERDMAGFKGIKPKLKRITKIWAQEQAVYSRTLRLAGRFDCMGEFLNVPNIIDFKTAGRVKSRDDISDYELQLAFYARAHNELYGTNVKNGVILMSVDAGMPMEFHIPLTDAIMQKLEARVSQFWSTATPPVLS